MSLEKLLEKIENDARDEGRRILEDAEREAARIRREVEEETRRESEAIGKSFQARAEGEFLKVVSQARLEGRILLLAAKERLLGEVFQEVDRAFKELPTERYRAWLKKAVLGSVVSGSEELWASRHDREILEAGLLDEINQELRLAGRRGELRLAEGTAPFQRGLVVRGERTETNLSAEAVLQKVREENEEEVSRILFGAEEQG